MLPIFENQLIFPTFPVAQNINNSTTNSTSNGEKSSKKLAKKLAKLGRTATPTPTLPKAIKFYSERQLKPADKASKTNIEEPVTRALINQLLILLYKD